VSFKVPDIPFPLALVEFTFVHRASSGCPLLSVVRHSSTELSPEPPLSDTCQEAVKFGQLA